MIGWNSTEKGGAKVKPFGAFKISNLKSFMAFYALSALFNYLNREAFKFESVYLQK